MSEDEVLLLRIEQKFHSEGECWVWHGAKRASTGYAEIYYKKRRQSVHRVIYELLVGKIPEGLHIDHLCRNRPCINPEHLEPVTLRENVLRGHGITAVNARKTACIKGHNLYGENLYTNSRGNRCCKKCLYTHQQTYKKRIKELARV